MRFNKYAMILCLSLLAVSTISKANDDQVKQCWSQYLSKPLTTETSEFVSTEEIKKEHKNVLNNYIKLLGDMDKKAEKAKTCIENDMANDPVFAKTQKEMEAKGTVGSNQNIFAREWAGANDPEYVKAKMLAKTRAQKACKGFLDDAALGRSISRSYFAREVKPVIKKLDLHNCAQHIKKYPEAYVNLKFIRTSPSGNDFIYFYNSELDSIDRCGVEGLRSKSACSQNPTSKEQKSEGVR